MDPETQLRQQVRMLIEKHRHTATGEPADLVQRVLSDADFPASPDAVRQVEDVLGPVRRKSADGQPVFDYDDVVQQSFPASDPPPGP